MRFAVTEGWVGECPEKVDEGGVNTWRWRAAKYRFFWNGGGVPGVGWEMGGDGERAARYWG